LPANDNINNNCFRKNKTSRLAMNPHHIHTLRYINKSLSGKAVRQEAGTLHPLIIEVVCGPATVPKTSHYQNQKTTNPHTPIKLIITYHTFE